ncbi:MAG: hypothetical protein AAF654_05580 [Myxococcota bacterium]
MGLVRYSPAVVGVGQDIELTFVTNEALLAAPRVEIGTAEALLDEARSETEFSLTYRVSPNDSDARVILGLADLSGNVAVVDAGLLPADVVPPTISSFDWVDTPREVNASSVLAFAGSLSPDTVSVTASLLDGSDQVLLSFPAALIPPTDIVTETRFSGAVSLADFPSGSFDSVSALTFELDVRDALGNRSDLTASRLPHRFYDSLAPDTTIIAQPDPVTRTREVRLEFSASEENASFECSIDQAEPNECASPLVAVLAPGAHEIQVTAVDAAQNRDPSPPVSVFEIAPLWSRVWVDRAAACGLGTDSTLSCWGDGEAFAGFATSETALPFTVQVNGSPLGFEATTLWAAQSLGTLCMNQRQGGVVTSYCRGFGPIGDGRLGQDYGLAVALGTRWVKLAVSAPHRCAIDTSGALFCWGQSTRAIGTGVLIDYPSPARVGTATDWVDIEVNGAGENAYSCGIRDDGTTRRLFCWGSSEAGKLGLGLDGGDRAPVTPEEVDLGDSDGDGEGETTLQRWVDVDLGPINACGIHTEDVSGQGSLWCWGANRRLFPSGQIRTRPQRIGNASNWVEVSMGEDVDGHRCARNALNEGFCWGANIEAQVSADGAPGAGTNEPVRVLEPTGWTSLAAGDGFTCGVTGAGALRCFGNRSKGRLGDGRPATSSAFVPVDSAQAWSSLSARKAGTCAIDSSGHLYCWGDAAGLDAGEASGFGSSSVPMPISGASLWTGVSRGSLPGANVYTCGVQTDGSAWCWGTNSAGQLGIGSVTEQRSPARVGLPGAQESDWLEVKASHRWTVGIRDDGGDHTLWWWGQIGDPSGRILAPEQASTLTGWDTVSPSPSDSFDPAGFVNRGHLCGIRNAGPAGTLWCWGVGSGGQLGDGGMTDRDDAVQVTSPATGWFDVASGDDHTCALRQSGVARELWCWGQYGASGDVSLPRLLARVDWRAVDAGIDFACALSEDGGVWGWGTATGVVAQQSSDPQRLGGGFESVSCSGTHLCALDTEGRAHCLGSDERGELGVGGSWGPSEVELPLP